MEVILKQPVINLGDKDDLVKVKPGYARNFLIPQGYAILATASAKKELAEKKRQAGHKQEFIKQSAEEEGAKLEQVSLAIETLAGADGKLFGSVTTIQIANHLKEKGFDIDRKQITVDDIRTTGEYTAQIHLHKEVKVAVKIEVTRKED
ncbi:50S ribosomal protein L9 [Pontibacter sp. G13]|uniref:50S ribosomal protein L9 n=1 Tax=Pontibacter sp. G13 TaxID=3074898 RepID=UPI0028898EEA|nr:50S ribosomal protein L9 [Pontibacter sp. G13]WNJ16719.1 50S ribosomal protein L9 [Pontibacter sp. G13]